MMNSIARQHSEIRRLLEEKGQEHRFDGIQVEVLNTVGEFLTTFKHASVDMEGERYPTINSVLLWYHRLRRHC
jgi:predicted YcjX-like family ATPase